MNFNDQLFMIEELNKRIASLEQINKTQKDTIDHILKQNNDLMTEIGTLHTSVETLSKEIINLNEKIDNSKSSSIHSSKTMNSTIISKEKSTKILSDSTISKSDNISEFSLDNSYNSLLKSYLDTQTTSASNCKLHINKNNFLTILNMAIPYITEYASSSLEIKEITYLAVHYTKKNKNRFQIRFICTFSNRKSGPQTEEVKINANLIYGQPIKLTHILLLNSHEELL